jgi:hypothetical protein
VRGARGLTFLSPKESKMDIRQQVTEWINGLSAAEMRLLSTVHPDVTLPDGRRFRGIQIKKDCWFGRDRQFWGYIDGSREAVILPLEDVLTRCTIREILYAYLVAKGQARQRSPRLYQYIYGTP